MLAEGHEPSVAGDLTRMRLTEKLGNGRRATGGMRQAEENGWDIYVYVVDGLFVSFVGTYSTQRQSQPSKRKDWWARRLRKRGYLYVSKADC